MSLRNKAGRLKRRIQNLLIKIKVFVTCDSVKVDYYGIKYLSSPNDALDYLTQTDSGFDNGLPWFLNSIISGNEIAIDIGANAGYYTIPLSRHFKEVYAFEPVPRIYKKLCNNIKINEITNVKTFPTAVGAVDEVLPYFIQSVVDGDQNINTGLSSLTKRENFKTKEISIDVNRLDTLFPTSKIEFIKVDVEGHEFQVFQGAKQIIIKQKPVIIWEASFNISKINALRSFDFLSMLDYKHFIISKENQLAKLTRREFQELDHDLNVLSCTNPKIDLINFLESH